MAVPDERFKPHSNGHQALVQRAERFLADQIMAQDPDIGKARANARATRQLAAMLGVSRSRVVQIRQEGHVPAKHWWAIERATGGHVTAADFERAHE